LPLQPFSTLDLPLAGARAGYLNEYFLKIKKKSRIAAIAPSTYGSPVRAAQYGKPKQN